jgi:hypothetical protein
MNRPFAQSVQLYKKDFTPSKKEGFCGPCTATGSCQRQCNCGICPGCLRRRFIGMDGSSRLGRLLNIDNLLLIGLLIAALYYKGDDSVGPQSGTDMDNLLTAVIVILIIVLIVRFMM